MTQQAMTTETMHADHRHWQRAISMWHDDITQWNAQQQLALEKLEKAAVAIKAHAQSLAEHREAIADIACGVEFHEKNLAGELRDHCAADLDEALAERHSRHAEEMERQRLAHERLKHHHHTVMAQIALLSKAINPSKNS